MDTDKLASVFSQIASAMFTRQSSHGGWKSFPSVGKDAHDTNRVSNPPQTDCDLHITNDGNLGALAATALSTAPIQLFIVDSDLSDDEIFDTSNVTADDFDVDSALAGQSHWKLLEVTVQPDGLIALGFMRNDKYCVDQKGFVTASSWEIITIGTTNGDTNPDSRRDSFLSFILITENGNRQFIITQTYNSVAQSFYTVITEMSDGLKIQRLESEGAISAENITDDSPSPCWWITTYGEPIPARPTPIPAAKDDTPPHDTPTWLVTSYPDKLPNNDAAETSEEK